MRSLETRAKSSTTGRTAGSIIAAIIVTQTPTYQPSAPRSVPGPPFMPCMRCTVTSQAANAPPSTTVASERERLVVMRSGDDRRDRSGLDRAAVADVGHRAVGVAEVVLDRAARDEPLRERRLSLLVGARV